MLNPAYATAAALALAALIHPVQGQLPGIETFLSRPNQTSVILNVQINTDPSALAPGYIFTSPYNDAETGVFGTQIYTMDGELVFSGQYLQEKRAMNSHVCNVEGEPSLCFTDAVPTHKYGTGHSSGPDRFFDNSYSQIGQDYGKANGLVLPDAHELNTATTLQGKSFIRDVFQPEQVDLTQYDGPEHGYILAGCFQQVEIGTGNVQFQWCSHEHVPLFETYSYIAGNNAGNQSNSKNKGTLNQPWDYFHINSIDRDHNGDYYVSSRQCHAIFKVAGPQSPNPGDIMWRLGGRYTDFKLSPKQNFSQQHDIRVHEVKGDETVVSLFDNHFPIADGTDEANATSAKWFRLNTAKKTVETLQHYIQPSSRFTPTGGQAQNLENGNAFIGWGKLPSVSEHRHGNPGEVLYYATFNNEYHSYKSYKSEWVGKPSLPPDVFAYRQYCKSSHVAVYMSWNGATEYKGFKVFAHQKKHASLDEATLLGTFKRKGYETQKEIKTSAFYKYITVQAIGSGGEAMGNSKSTKVFVPNRKLAVKCSSLSCPAGTDYGSQQSLADQC